MTTTELPNRTVAFLGSRGIGFDCLDYLLSHQAELNIRVVQVLTSDTISCGSNKSVPNLAQYHGIPVDEGLEALMEVDFIISVQYHKILRADDIQKGKILAINLHMAPLPEYRGCNQFSFALIDRAVEFGTTIHRLEKSIDGGAIIAERRFPIPLGCFVNELYSKTVDESLTLFKEQIGLILNNQYSLTPQVSLLNRRATSFHLRKEIATAKIIPWEWDKEQIERHIRGTAMPGFEPPILQLCGKRIKLVVEDY